MPTDNSIIPAIAGASSGLPDPYGVGFEESVSQLELTKDEWKRIENIRVRAGALVSNPFFVAFRNISGVLIALVALSGVIAPEVISPLMGFAFVVFIPIFIIALAPSVIASESSWRAFSLRTSLWEQGGMRGGKERNILCIKSMDARWLFRDETVTNLFLRFVWCFRVFCFVWKHTIWCSEIVFGTDTRLRRSRVRHRQPNQ